MATTHYATKPKSKLTVHQIDVLRIVIKGNAGATSQEEGLADLDQVLERVARKTTKSSLQFTIRALVINGMIAKLPQQQRRGRMRVVYQATASGLAIGADRAPAGPSFVVPLGSEDIDLETD